MCLCHVVRRVLYSDGYAERHTVEGQVRPVLDLSAYSSRPSRAHRSRSSGASGTTFQAARSRRSAGANVNATEGGGRGRGNPDVDLCQGRSLSLGPPVWPVALAAAKRHACWERKREKESGRK